MFGAVRKGVLLLCSDKGIRDVNDFLVSMRSTRTAAAHMWVISNEGNFCVSLTDQRFFFFLCM